MKKQIFILLSLILCGCSSITVPDSFTYKEIETKDFKLASWQKISNPQGVYKIYIEGDGYAFNAYGKPTQNPTPILPQYEITGEKSSYGKRSHTSVRQALRRFKMFLAAEKLV